MCELYCTRVQGVPPKPTQSDTARVSKYDQILYFFFFNSQGNNHLFYICSESTVNKLQFY